MRMRAKLSLPFSTPVHCESAWQSEEESEPASHHPLDQKAKPRVAAVCPQVPVVWGSIIPCDRTGNSRVPKAGVMTSGVPHHSYQGPAHLPPPNSHEPCFPPILLTHTSGPNDSQPSLGPWVSWKQSQIHRVALKSGVSHGHSVPGSSQTSPQHLLALSPGMFFWVDSPLVSHSPRCQP